MDNSKILEKNYQSRKSVVNSLFSPEQMLDLALTILKKPLNARNHQEIQMLMKCTEEVRFFQNLGSETHEQCCKHMFHKYIKSDTVLFEIGTIGTTFYIILKGSVEIWVNIPKPIDPDSKKPPKIEFVLTNVKSLKAGESFGELALIDNKPRAATIICKENCHLAVLEKNHFNKILKVIEQKKLLTQIEFLFKYEIFEGWSFGAVKRAYYHMEKKKYIRKQIVYKQKDEPDGVYFIESGSFQVSVNIVKKPSEIDESDFSLTNFKPIQYHSKAIFFLRDGEYFGEEELITNEKRKYTVECISQEGELFLLEKKEFIRRVMSVESSKEFLLKNIKIKNEWNQAKIQNFSINNINQDSHNGEPPHFDSNEFSIDKVKVFNESINNFDDFKPHNSTVTKIQRFASTDQKFHKITSNLRELFCDDLRGMKKTVSKTLYDKVLKYKKNHTVKVWSPNKNMKISSEKLDDLIKITDQTAIKKRPSKIENRKENIGKQQFCGINEISHISHQKIREKMNKIQYKFVNFGSFEIVSKDNTSKFFHQSLTNNRLMPMNNNDDEKKPKFIVLNGRNNSFLNEKDDKFNKNRKIKPIMPTMELIPLKYISEKIYESKFKDIWKKKKAFSFH